ncbi:MAG: hypothetical protein R3B70_29665 [Polyangiaceae bacterium]
MSRFSVLRHPLFLFSLLLLLANDHLLKGAGVLPGAVTGKLSDFAGLLVAPVFVAALFGARTRGGRALAFAAPAAVFVAINVSGAAASALVAAAGLVGMKWRVWQDPTDLAALVMLVPAWRLSARGALGVGREAESGSAGGGRQGISAGWVAERALIATTGIACMATSAVPGPGTYSTTAYLINSELRPIDVRVRWVDATLDCEGIMNGDPTRMLGANVFNLGITYRLNPQATLPLERVAALTAAGKDPTETGVTNMPTGCEVVLIESDGMPTTMLWWGALETVQVTATTGEMDNFYDLPGLEAGRVMLRPPKVETPGLVKQAPLQINVAPSSCATAGKDQLSIQWTSPNPNMPSVGIVEEVQELPGGCLGVTLSYPQDGGIPDGGAGGADPGTGGAGGADPGTGGAGGADPGTGGAGGANAGGAGGRRARRGRCERWRRGRGGTGDWRRGRLGAGGASEAGQPDSLSVRRVRGLPLCHGG